MLHIDPNALTKERMAFRLAVLLDAVANDKFNEHVYSPDGVDYDCVVGVAEKIADLSDTATPEDHDRFAVTSSEYDQLMDLRSKWYSFAQYGGKSACYRAMGRDMNYFSRPNIAGSGIDRGLKNE